MEQLYQVIKQRFQKLQIILKNKLNSDQLRDLRQQQKIRCQKQAWILSMFRAKKSNLNINIKTNYYKYSYEIMKIIDPNFVFENQPNLSDETFLNDFVCLYTNFFDSYEDKFQFKVKIRNLLRPTNHNILNDMIKYLSDFSKDYSQHIYLWQLKQTKKNQEISDQNQKKIAMGHNIQSAIYQSTSAASNLNGNLVKQKTFQSFRNSTNFSQNGLKRNPQDNENELILKKAQFNKIYGILDIQSFPNFIYTDKTKTSVDVLRLKMNQIYRDMKFRNSMIKSLITLYHNQYNLKYSPDSINSNLNNKQNVIQDNHTHINNNYRVSLIIQRNGFSCINIVTNDQRLLSKDQRNLSPLKEKQRLSSLSNKQSSIGSTPQIVRSVGKTQFVLNSLKILRVSQNFLPPLLNIKQSIRISSEEELTKQSDVRNKRFSQSNTQNIIKLQVQSAKQLDDAQSNGMIYYNQQLLRQAQRRKIQKKRISQMRKHFTSQQRYKNKSIKKNDPEQKIVQWLDKINIMKQLQRKKILGLG